MAKADILEEAKQRGFVDGAEFISMTTGNKCVVNGLNLYKDGRLCTGRGICIYNAKINLWAEIIPPPSKIDQLIKELMKETGANHVQLIFDK